MNEIPKGSTFHCDGVMLIYHVLEGAELGNVAGEARWDLMQFCLCIVQRAQGKWGYVCEDGANVFEACCHRTQGKDWLREVRKALE